MSLGGLVAYGSDSDSNSGDEDEQSSTAIPGVSVSSAIPSSTSKNEFRSVQNEESDDEEAETMAVSKTSQLISLPKPHSVSMSSLPEEIGPIPPKKIYGDEDKILPPSATTSLMAKKVKGIVKISIPSLKDFDNDVEDDITQKKRPMEASKKGSGLFALLPPPKNDMVVTIIQKKEPSLPTSSATVSQSSSSSSSSSSTSKPNSLIPHSVQQVMAGKRPPPSKLEEIRAKYLKQEANVKVVHKKGKEKPGSDDSDDDDGPLNFFTLDEKLEADPSTLEKLKLPMPSFQPRIADTPQNDDGMIEEREEAGTSVGCDHIPYIPKAQRGKGEINFIEVNAADLRSENNEWIKNLTDQSAIPPRQHKAPGGLFKRKHQITYLALEAKAREQELQNQWAANRASKQHTKSKYGF